MDNVDELRTIKGNFIVTAAKEYDVTTICNFGELQMNLEELQKIIGNSPS